MAQPLEVGVKLRPQDPRRYVRKINEVRASCPLCGQRALRRLIIRDRRGRIRKSLLFCEENGCRWVRWVPQDKQPVEMVIEDIMLKELDR